MLAKEASDTQQGQPKQVYIYESAKGLEQSDQKSFERVCRRPRAVRSLIAMNTTFVEVVTFVSLPNFYTANLYRNL